MSAPETKPTLEELGEAGFDNVSNSPDESPTLPDEPDGDEERGEIPDPDLHGFREETGQKSPVDRESSDSPVFGSEPTTPTRFELLQQWKGTVRNSDDESVTAVVEDLTDPENDREVVTFDRREVPDSDADLLEEGAVFYWSIGYEHEPGGQQKRVSKIRFRRLPAWTEDDLERARERAEEFQDLFE
ncbi:MAG: hypothetical protein ABEL76_14460 [Bradymonadaceae bacterium]